MRSIFLCLSAALMMLAFSPCAMAQQFSSGAILATAGAPKQVILRTLPLITRPEAVAASAGAALAEQTSMLSGKFPGLGSWCGGATPPNAALAVGPTFVLQVIKPCLAVYDKSGNLQPGFPISLKSIPIFGPNDKMVGPRALYDWANNRYIVVGGHVTRSAPYESFIDVGISWSSDPRDGWFFYSLNLRGLGVYGENGLLDAPALGQDRRAIYVSFNLFDLPDGFPLDGPIVLILPKLKMYAGQAFTFFSLGYSAFQISALPYQHVDSLQPANVMNPGDNPRAEFMINSLNLDYACFAGCEGLVIWAISNPLYYPGTSGPELSHIVVPTTNTYYTPNSAAQAGCNDFPCRINTGDVRISGEVTYASGSLYAALTTNGTANTDGAASAHILWFQVRPFLNDSDPACTGVSAGNCPQIIDAQKLNEVCWDCDKAQGSDGSGARFYPTVQPDPEGNVTLIFNYSDDTMHPSSEYASNRVTQVPNTMHDDGKILQSGQAFYFPFEHSEYPMPWGNYTAAALDLTPATQPSIWFTAETSKSLLEYRTAIGHSAYTRSTQP